MKDISKRRIHQNGFTLVELLIVISVIGVLATAMIIIINPLTQLQKARDGRRKADLEQIRAALEQYRSDQGNYPVANLMSSCGVSLTDGATTTYMQSIPCDPLGNSSYNLGVYYYKISGTTYTITACLENLNDPQGTTISPGVGGCSGHYYTISNP